MRIAPMAVVGLQSGARVIFQVWMDAEGTRGRCCGAPEHPSGESQLLHPLGQRGDPAQWHGITAPAEEGDLPLFFDCCSFSCLFYALAFLVRL